MNYLDDLLTRFGGNTGVAGPNGTQIGRMQVPGYQSPGERAPDPGPVIDTNPVATEMPAGKGTKTGGFADPASYDLTKSPKGQFLNLANQDRFGYGQGGEMLAELQKLYPDHWKNVSYDGRDRFNIGPGAHADWGDADAVDFMAAFDKDKGTAKDFYWGVEGPTSRAQASQGQGGQMGAVQGGLHQLLTGNPTAGIQAALGQQAGQSDFLAALLKQLGVA